MRPWTALLFGVVIVFDQPAQGYTVSGSTYNTNGSSSDVQAAINAAPNGATIRIPAGSFSWSTAVSLSSPLHLLGAGANATTITCGVATSGSLNLGCSNAGNIEVGGISFVEGNFTPNYEALVEVSGASTGQPANPNGVVLLHDCNFAVNQNGEDCLLWQTNGGVIWNCTFSSQDIDCAGVYCKDALGSTQPGDPSPSSFAYWQWQGQLNWSLQYEGGFSLAQVGNLDAFIQANPPSTN